MHLRNCAALLAGGALLLASPLNARADDPDAPAVDITDPEEETPAPDAAGTAPATDVHHADDDDATHAVENIVITATPIAHDKDELATPVTRMDREEMLHQELGATIGETLVRQPGIATTGFSGGASRPVIRGQDAFRTEVTEDGLTTQDVSRESPDHAVPVNPLSVERLEVVRGPATLRYGGGAVGGVVNAITNRVPDTLPDNLVTGELFGAIDSVAERRDLSIKLDGGVGPVGYHVDALLRDTDDYRIPTGGRQNGTEVDAFAASAGLAYFLGENARVGLAYSRFESEYGIPEEDEDVEIDLETNRIRFEGDWFGPMEGISELRLRGSYTDYEHDEKVEGEIGQTYENDQIDVRFEMLHNPIFGFLGALGVTGRHRDFKALGEAAEFLSPTDTWQVAGYFFEEIQLASPLVAELGFRVEGTNVEGTPAPDFFGTGEEFGRRDRQFVPISGSLGLVYTPTESLTFGAVGAVSQRAPDAVELFARGPHEATGTFEIGNDDFDEETGFTAELRMTFARDRYRVDVSGFYTYYDDYIFGQLTDIFVDEEDPTLPGDLELLFYRDRNAFFAGAEFFGSADLYQAPWGGIFGVDGQFDYVRARFTSGSDRNVPRITPIRWGLNLFYRGDWVTGRFGFIRTEEQTDVSNFENSTDDFTFLNVRVTLSLAKLYPRVPVEFTFQGTNLMDKRGRNVVSFNADEVRLPGNNFRGAVRVRF